MLPANLLIGYSSSYDILQSINHGVNVVIWFSIDLITKHGKPYIARGVDYDQVNKVNQQVDIVNMICIGGWNEIHPDTSVTPAEMFHAFEEWVQETSRDSFRFSGIDWDIEGHDDLNSDRNTFTVERLDWIGQFSQLAKAKGYYVSMAPAESYLDPTTSKFDLSLTHEYPEWNNGFAYHGHNIYSYLLSRYGMTSGVPTFDFVTVQFYESYSHLLYDFKILGVPNCFCTACKRYFDGWRVDFGNEKELNWPSANISVKPTQFVVGLANAWADNQKTLFMRGADIAKDFSVMKQENIRPRGFAVWNLKDEGMVRDGHPVYLMKELNDVMHNNAIYFNK